ncbi:MAG: hypothetical protein KGD68_08795 [Candidatus Lokiarchaeota archaeon]|nr:hypothetical protein [Candidatus Lokiarchaeota archaeon]
MNTREIMDESYNLRVGVISDGKYGERAFENIKKRFKASWIKVPDIPLNVILDDDVEMSIPDCDMYISYVRHPDIITQLAELQKPLILGVLPGYGLYEQAKRLNSHVIHAPTMCSLENNTGIDEIDLFTSFYGNPIYNTIINQSGFVEEIEVKRSSLCGSSEAGARFLINKQFNEENLQNFALRVCHECRAPRFGKTCDKEVAGIIHLVSLFDGISSEIYLKLNDDLKQFISRIKNDYITRKKNSKLN